jgi:hypothetical protein
MSSMKRRRALAWIGAGGLLATGAGTVWLQGTPPPVQGFADVDAARRWLDALTRAPAPRSLSAWPLAHVFEHLAQSIEFSRSGFPELKAAWFRASLGALAFAAFSRRGRMHHSTVEPIPGAPALAAVALSDAAQRLERALREFEALPEDAALAPHFAYGALSKHDYRRAHLMHLADHAREIVTA